MNQIVNGSHKDYPRTQNFDHLGIVGQQMIQQEYSMRKAIVFAAGSIMVTGLTLSPPAAATEVREAVRLCDANPNCAYGGPDPGGGMQLIVQTSQGEKLIDCPPKGPCTVMIKVPKGDKRVSGTVGNVTTILTGSPRKSGEGQKDFLRAGAAPPSGGILERDSGLPSQGPARTGTSKPAGGGTIY